MPKSTRSEERRKVILCSVRTQKQMTRTEETKFRAKLLNNGTLFLRYLVMRPSAFLGDGSETTTAFVSGR